MVTHKPGLILNDPNKRLLRLAQHKLGFEDLVNEHVSISPIHVKACGAHVARIAHLLVNRVQNLNLIGVRACIAKLVACLFVNSIVVLIVQLPMKAFDGDGG